MPLEHEACLLYVPPDKGGETVSNSIGSKKTGEKIVIFAICVLWVMYQLYLAMISPLHPMLQSPVHLIFGLIVVFLFHPANEKHPEKKWLRIFDVLIYAGIAFLLWYTISQTVRLQQRVPYISPVIQLDIVAMIVTMIVLMESVRRILGWSLFIFIAIFIFYMWFGNIFPGIFRFKGTNLKKFTELMIMGVDGIYLTLYSLRDTKCQ